MLVVDDETNARTALTEILRGEGYLTENAADGFKALAKLEEFPADVVLTDLRMPGIDGLDFMEKAKAISPGAIFIVMTAFGTIQNAVGAMKRGAENYLTKPLDFETTLAVVERAMEKARLLHETRVLRDRLRERNAFGLIVTEDPKMRAILDLVAQIGPSRASVLIYGESGTGKELIAAAIHAASTRVNRPFVRLNCAALAESLLESELFGHEKGAFTGAVQRREGRFKQADGGTLFLDEISEIPPGTQVKLLRFLQERTFERVGGNETLKVDVRIIAATNRDLKTEIESNRFRDDLYWRLNVLPIELPPLRDRRGDVPLLADFFLRRYAVENGRSLEGFTGEALAKLGAYNWPGNVRELENVIERAVVLSDKKHVGVEHLPSALVPQDRLDREPKVPGASIAEIERFAILRTLEVCGGSTSKAAAILGMSTRKIQYKLHEYSGATTPPDTDSER